MKWIERHREQLPSTIHGRGLVEYIEAVVQNDGTLPRPWRASPWSQLATLAGLKPSGWHGNAGRQQLRRRGSVTEANDLVTATPAGMQEASEVPSAPSPPAERLAL